MDESAIKGLKLLELNDNGADSQTPCSTSTTISVEGYDTTLKEYPLKLVLEKHFASCGKITNIYVPKDFERKILKSVAFMRIEGEDVEEKALQLSGTDVGGWTAIVKPAPLQKVFIDDPCCPDLLLPRQTKHTRSALRDMTLRFLRLISRWLCVNISLHVERSGELWFSVAVQLTFIYVNG